VIEVEQGEPIRVLELVTCILMDAGTNREVRERAESLYSDLAAMFLKGQFEAVQAQVQSRTLEDLVQEVLAD
jgi:hypothetical protein